MNIDWKEFAKRVNSLKSIKHLEQRADDGQLMLIQCPRCGMLHSPDEYECERCGWEFGFSTHSES